MYPKSIENNDNVPASEKEVFKKLSHLSDDFHVFHSVHWTDERDGECDFIIFNQKYGFIALEVKGGEIHCRNNEWYSYNHPVKSPIEQARKAIYFIKNYYEEMYGTFRGTFCWGVCFPDIEWSNDYVSFEIGEGRVLDYTGLKKVGRWVENLFKKSGWKQTNLTDRDSKQFMSLINKSLQVPLSLKKAIELQEQKLKEINLVQDYLLDLFDDKNKIGFQGAAGTGKTWIAIKKAARLANENKKTLVLCYNKEVNKFIKSKLESYSNIHVSTFHAFALKILSEFFQSELQDETVFYELLEEFYNIGHPKKDDEDRNRNKRNINQSIYILKDLSNEINYQSILQKYKNLLSDSILDVIEFLLPSQSNDSDEENDFYTTRIPLATIQVFESNSSIVKDYFFDAILVDEGQDFHPNWCECLKHLFGKYRSRIFYVFYDDNQKIFSKKKDLPITDLIVNAGLGNHLFKLKDNLRNTKRIHDFSIQKTRLGETARPLELEGVPPEEMLGLDEVKARKFIEKKLHSLLKEFKIDKEKILVLSNRSIENSIFGSNRKLGEFTLTEGEGKRANNIRFRTIQNFKGLESDIVILLVHKRDETENENYCYDELLYVGCTRAKHLLFLVEIV